MKEKQKVKRENKAKRYKGNLSGMSREKE